MNLVELFDWERQEARINLSTSSMEPIDSINVLEKYEDGDPHEIIAEFYGVEKENVLFVHGAQEGMFLSLLAIKPEEIHIPVPIYPTVFMQAKILGIKVNYIDSPYDVSRGCIALVNPNNPTGEYIDVDELVGKGVVVVDEIFKPFVSRDFEYIPGTILVMSSSKFYSVKGRKVGWIISERKIIDRIKDIRDLVTPPPIYDQELINYIIPNHDYFWKRNIGIIRKNYEVLKRINQYFHILYGEYMPVAVLYREGLRDMDFAKNLFKNYDVLLTPTTYFLLYGGLRILLGISRTDYIVEAINSINKLFTGIKLP